MRYFPIFRGYYKFRRIITSSIIRRTLFFIIIISSIITLMSSMIFFWMTYNEAIEKLHKISQITGRRLSNTLSYSLWNLDEEFIRNALNIEIEDDNIHAIIIRNIDINNLGIVKNSRGFVELYDHNKHNLKNDKSLIMRKHGIFYKNKNIGSLIIYYTPDIIQKEIAARFIYEILLVVTIVSFIIAIVFIIFRQTVLSPIVQLKTSVTTLANKDFSARINNLNDDEIGDLAKSFNIMADTIEDYNYNLQYLVHKRTNELINAKKMASIGEMVAGIAHEMNTPIGNAMTAGTYAYNLAQKILEAFEKSTITRTDFLRQFSEVTESLTIININMIRTSELINTFKKIALDRKNELLKDIPIKEFINGIVLSLKPKIFHKHVDITIQCPEGLKIYSYAGLLSQVYINLITNAVLHGIDERDSGKIIISSKIENTDFILEVCDDGEGVSDKNISRIFEPFFTTKRNRGGTGLGLNIVYNIVTYNLEGTVVCTNNNGAVFTVRFPLEQHIADGIPKNIINPNF